MDRKEKIVSLLIVVLSTGFHACRKNQQLPRNSFALWDTGCEAIRAITEYVEDVTDPSSPDFIPEKDRIVVSDMDGTICGEKSPIYTSWLFYSDYVYGNRARMSEEAVAVADTISLAARTGVIPHDLEKRHFQALAEVFAGTSVDDFRNQYRNFLNRPSAGYEGILTGDEFFLPMIELFKYLESKGFTIYICSGTDRDLVRVAVEKWLDIPYYRIIGTDTLLEGEKQFSTKTDGLEYVLEDDERMVRTDKYIIKTVKANKASQLAQELGQKPVLSFGNSTGDISMNQYATKNNRYRSLAFMVIADDETRENGNYEKAMELKSKWSSYGWISISMKDDFRTIYGPEAVKKK